MRLREWAFSIIKIFFFLFLKADFVFFIKRCPQAVDITEPPVEMHFYRLLIRNRLWNWPISTGL